MFVYLSLSRFSEVMMFVYLSLSRFSEVMMCVLVSFQILRSHDVCVLVLFQVWIYGKGENTGKTDVAETFIWVLVGT